LAISEVRVTRRGEDRLAAGHLWVYASEVEERGAAAPGSTVRVLSARRRFLGIAHYSSSSQITLRMLSRDSAGLDPQFYLRRIQAAWDHRRRVVKDSDAFRLVHSEGDLLPGLVADFYNGALSVQFLTQGMDRVRDRVLAALRQVAAPRAIVARDDAAVRKLEELPQGVHVVEGSLEGPVEFSFNGLRWEADLLGGQKTGGFLDQRENYAAAARYARGRALDAFTCTGGFALHLARACESVEGVEASAEALATAAHNRDRNALPNVSFREADVFDLLSGYVQSRRRFDTVVLDPPAFAKTKANREAALRGYREVNGKALRLLEKGGTLVTCSCSYHVSEADLLEVAAEASLEAGRTLRVLERRTQAADHPVLLTVPETLYLKCLVLEVL
jgi:23S rRNA (cytosine1962-C5)-methyltransferase